MSIAISNTESQASKGITWSIWSAVLLTLFAFVAAQYFALLIVSIYPMLHDWHAAQAQSWSSSSIVAQFFYVLIAESITFGLLVGFVRWRKGSLQTLGLKRPQFMEDVPFAFIGLLIYFPLYIFITIILTNVFHGIDTQQQQVVGFNNASTLGPLFLAFISLVILPPIIEEFTFRGFLYTTLRKRFSFNIAVLFTSVLFASPHLLEAESGGALWIAGIDTFTLSMVLCWLRERTGRLYAGMGLHALKNSIAFFILFISPQLHLWHF